MSLESYSALKTEIANHLDRSDLTSDIDTFIDICEARNKRELRLADGSVIPPVLLNDMQTRTSLTVNARHVSVPAGLIQAKHLRLLTSPVTVLTEVSAFEMSRIRTETNGKPEFFTVHADIEFNKAPDASYSGEIIYYDTLTALSDSNTTNALLDEAPDIYLYGALAAAEPFLMHDERVAIWNGLYVDGRTGLAGTQRRRNKTGPLFSRVAGARP